ncbi:flagellar hook-associated protein FlgK [Bacillaceae bacterium S4-13-58]
MSSTFFGLETARRALTTQQSALYTTGNNIANANTEGYTRQRVNFEQTSPYPPASRNREQIPGQMGTGVTADSVQRIRDQFLDIQYRGENSKLGYYDSKAAAMRQMEDILNEPSEEGLSKVLDQFWQSLQDLAVNPEESGARSVVRQRGISVAETFKYMSSSLSSIRTDLEHELEVTKTELNSLLNQLQGINQQIGEIEPHGYLPNNLYDERDILLDKLSSLANIKVSYVGSGGQPNAIAEGRASVELVGPSGASYNPPVMMLDGATNQVNQMTINFDNSLGQNAIGTIEIGGQTFSGANFTSKGKVQALIESYGYIDNGVIKGEYPEMLDNLDKMAFEFATEFNHIHKGGYDLNGTVGGDFFVVSANYSATNLDVVQAIKDNGDLIAASNDTKSGDGGNASDLANVLHTSLPNLGQNTTVKSFYESAIGEMAVITQEAIRQTNNADVLRQQVEERRQSVSGVSLDEEMTNMIKFQHAYNAAARSMTAVDEMLDRIINQMGLVGR